MAPEPLGRRAEALGTTRSRLLAVYDGDDGGLDGRAEAPANEPLDRIDPGRRAYMLALQDAWSGPRPPHPDTERELRAAAAVSSRVKPRRASCAAPPRTVALPV